MYLTFTNKNIEIYFKEIRSNSSITREDEIVLFGRIARGDKSAEMEVFNKTAKLAVAVAKTYTGTPELLSDLIQEANMGILTAIRKYDPSLGFRFSTYARWYMKANITFFLNNMGIVHPSNTIIADKAKKIRESFYKIHQREITEYELMEKLEEMGDVITDVSVITKIMVSRIDAMMDEESDIEKKEFGEFALSTSSYNDYENEIEEESLSDLINKKLSVLTERESAMVKMFYGIGVDREMKYDEIQNAWNTCHPELKPIKSAERVRQIINDAIAKMK